MAQMLYEGYGLSGGSFDLIDGYAWMILSLGEGTGSDLRYYQLISMVKERAKVKKIKKFAIRALKKLRKRIPKGAELPEQFQPGSINLSKAYQAFAKDPYIWSEKGHGE